MTAERVYTDPVRGVTIPLSTIVEGGKSGVISHLSDGLHQAEKHLEGVTATWLDAKNALEQADLEVARADAQVRAWSTAYDAAKRAFGR
jgi:hypothetical protein